MTAIAIIKDISQIVFWAVGAVIAILSFRQAKKSIFQPAKNEVFKVQIASIQSLLKELNWKSSLEAWQDSGLDTSAEITLGRAFESFALHQHGTKIMSDRLNSLVSVGGIISPEAKGFRLIKGPADEVDSEDKSLDWPPIWSDFTWETFSISERLDNLINILGYAASDPVLPRSVISSIEALLKEIHESAIRAAKDVESAVREFPRHYPSQLTLKSADLTWAHNMREERGVKIFAKLNELRKATRDYLRSDMLLDNK